MSEAPARAALPTDLTREVNSAGIRPMRPALSTFSELPKPPAMYKVSIFSGLSPAVFSNVRMPACTALLASCTARISACVRQTGGVNIAGASSINPVSSIASVSSRPATASIRPLPQMPTGATSPMTCTWNGLSVLSSARYTRSIAPALPPMPMLMPAPSNAGPAAVEQASRRPSILSTISPLVPMSVSSSVCPAEYASAASSADVMSAPTNAAMQRGR